MFVWCADMWDDGLTDNNLRIERGGRLAIFKPQLNGRAYGTCFRSGLGADDINTAWSVLFRGWSSDVNILIGLVRRSTEADRDRNRGGDYTERNSIWTTLKICQSGVCSSTRSTRPLEDEKILCTGFLPSDSIRLDFEFREGTLFLTSFKTKMLDPPAQMFARQCDGDIDSMTPYIGVSWHGPQKPSEICVELNPT